MLVTSSALITNQKGIDYMSKYNTKCGVCGKKIYRKPNEIKKSKTGIFYCGKECFHEGSSRLQYQKASDKLGEDLKGFIERKYHEEMLNTREIAKLVYGRRNMGPNIIRWMERLGIETRSRSEAVSLQWVDNDERRKRQSEFTKEYLSDGTPAREKLIKVMQTDEYKSKSSMAKMGSNNPMWDPNKTDEEREREKIHSRRVPGYKDFRRNVYERDNYTCQVCGDESGGNLVAHHLNGFHWDIKGRTDIDNGVTMCIMCHKEFHKIYGIKNVNLFQFSQFKEYKQQALNN